MKNCICIHGHFYQPPRENPWLEAIERQESAQPYHDWNQRVSAECYAPNGLARILGSGGRIEKIINNYARISFNFGPTLLTWMEKADPETYERVLAADQLSCEHYSGHGSALAQSYNHAILPLCNTRDKVTQIVWGIRDFTRRFGRDPEGLWLPETAVDLETLNLLAQHGIRFVILAPHQAGRVRATGENKWRSLTGQSIDTTLPYRINLSTGRTLALFFYDGVIANEVGFQKLLSDGSSFVNRLLAGFGSECDRARLVHFAVDGETFGHHHRFGEMALAYALDRIENETGARLTNYGEYLEQNPPAHEVEILENTSWSCCHGIERWHEDCGCSSGAHSGWNQKWRAPLRQALDNLRDQLAPIYEAGTKDLLRAPWDARNDYIDLIVDRSPEARRRFLAAHAQRPLSEPELVRVMKLLEIQRHALLMFTSCGWFFDDISGIETLQVLQYAGRAIQLAQELRKEIPTAESINDIETAFLATLQEARSNRPEMGNGRDLYQKFVKPAILDNTGIAGHYVFHSLFHDFPEHTDFYACHIERTALQNVRRGNMRLIMGSFTVTSTITLDAAAYDFAALYPWSAGARLHLKGGKNIRHAATDIGQIMSQLRGAFEKEDILEVLAIMNRDFTSGTFKLSDLIRDEQQKIFDVLFTSLEAELDRHSRQTFDRVAPLVRSMLDLGLAPPPRFAAIADAQLHAQLLDEFRLRPVQADRVQDLLDMAETRNLQWRRSSLEVSIREIIEQLACELRQRPEDAIALRNFATAVRAVQLLPFAMNFHNTQNHFYLLLQSHYAPMRAAAARGETAASDWIKETEALARLLSIRVD